MLVSGSARKNGECACHKVIRGRPRSSSELRVQTPASPEMSVAKIATRPPRSGTEQTEKAEAAELESQLPKIPSARISVELSEPDVLRACAPSLPYHPCMPGHR